MCATMLSLVIVLLFICFLYLCACVCACVCVCVHMYFSVGAEMPLCGECMCTSVIVILVFCAIPQALPIFFFLFIFRQCLSLT